ncbi:MAG TPA: hypothetical protein VEN82_04040 [Actinomycetota bacterium]|nr:hypothetical protein [Actinomycetota bacterium]
MIAAGHGWGLAVFPLAASAVAFVFAGVLGRRFARKRRASEGAWTAALLMYAVGSLAMFLGVVRGWTIGDYRTYWLFGAVLNVPYLFLGEVYLLTRWRAVGHGLALVLVALSAFAAVSVWSARLHGAALGSALPLGKDAFGHGATPYRLAQYYALPAYFLLLGGLTWSAWRMKGRPDLKDRTAGTIWIALGATVVAVGSGIGAGFHLVPLFSVSLAAGVTVMFAGFLVAGRPARPA